MCTCSTQSIRCLDITVAELCCPKIEGCCNPKVQLASISDATKQDFVDGNTAAIDPAELALLERYAAAIEVAAETLAGRVCLARYGGGGCSLCARLCVPCPPCVSDCRCGACDDCRRGSVLLQEIGDCVDPGRIVSVAVDGNPASLNGDDPAAAFEVTTHSGVRLFGPTVDHGGRIEVCFEVAASALFRQAVLSYACASVPCHDRACERGEGEPTQLDIAESGLTGDEFGDRLNVECLKSGRVRLGRRPTVDSVRWVV